MEPVGVAGTYGSGMVSVVMWSQWVSPGWGWDGRCGEVERVQGMPAVCIGRAQ